MLCHVMRTIVLKSSGCSLFCPNRLIQYLRDSLDPGTYRFVFKPRGPAVDVVPIEVKYLLQLWVFENFRFCTYLNNEPGLSINRDRKFFGSSVFFTRENRRRWPTKRHCYIRWCNAGIFWLGSHSISALSMLAVFLQSGLRRRQSFGCVNAFD